MEKTTRICDKVIKKKRKKVNCTNPSRVTMIVHTEKSETIVDLCDYHLKSARDILYSLEKMTHE